MGFSVHLPLLSSPGRQHFPATNHINTSKERKGKVERKMERGKGKERGTARKKSVVGGGAVGLFFDLFYFKFGVRVVRFVLLCLNGKVFTSVFIWLLFAFFFKRKGRCVEGVVFVCF